MKIAFNTLWRGIDFSPTAKNAPFKAFLGSADLAADLPTHVAPT